MARGFGIEFFLWKMERVQSFFPTRIHAHQTILRIRYTSFKVDDVELEKLQNYTRTRTHLVHTRWNDIEISFWWNFKSSSLQDNVMNRYNTHIIHMCIQLDQELLAAVCRLISRKISLKPVHKFALRVKVSAGLPRSFLEFKSIFNDKFTPINKTKCLWYNPLKWVGWVRECVRVTFQIHFIIYQILIDWNWRVEHIVYARMKIMLK